MKKVEQKVSEQVNDLIKQAYNLSASDIHFHPIDGGVRIYFRMINHLKFQKEIELNLYLRMIRYIKFMTRLDISITKFPQDGSFTVYADSNEKLFIRVSTIPLIDNESLVIRILPDETFNNFEDIALFPEDLDEIYDEVKNKNGLFIFTGPTGSGKTTSMYSILDKLAKIEHKKILTLENPIEIINDEFVQMQINEEMNITYSVGLKASLRQDPDVIMIGEIRDEETARNVFRAGLTGHTVISTMHTKNKYGVIERLIDFGFLPSEIKSVLIGVSNQRLVVDIDDDSKAFYDFAMKSELEEMIESEKEVLDIDYKIEKLKKQGIIKS